MDKISWKNSWNALIIIFWNLCNHNNIICIYFNNMNWGYSTHSIIKRVNIVQIIRLIQKTFIYVCHAKKLTLFAIFGKKRILWIVGQHINNGMTLFSLSSLKMHHLKLEAATENTSLSLERGVGEIAMKYHFYANFNHILNLETLAVWFKFWWLLRFYSSVGILILLNNT